jgi:O-antigen/teichoic acid export membrane protein
VIARERLSLSQIFARLSNDSGGDRRGHTYAHIIKGVVTAIGGRLVGVLTNFIAVPLTVRYLGAEKYGVWVTLSSILSWITIFDLGVGSTAVNRISEALAHNDLAEAKIRVYAGYISVVLLAFVLAVAVIAFWPFVSWPALLGSRVPTYSIEINEAAACAFIVFLLNFPLSITPRVLGVCHKVAESNYWNAFGSVLSLLLLVLVTRFHAQLPELVLAFSGATLLSGLLSTIWLYRKFEWLRPALWSVPYEKIRELIRTGLPFFAVQISGVLLLQTDNIIIAQVLGAREVTPYSVTWRLFSYASLLQVLAIPALWPAYADAFARKDYPWVQQTYGYNLKIALGSTIACVVVLLIVAKRFIALWAGPAAVPSSGLIFGMGAWSILSVVSWCESCLLGAAGRVKGQAIYSAIGAAVNIAVSIWFCKVFGLIGVILGTLCAYSVCIVIPQTIEVRRTISGNDSFSGRESLGQ